MHLEQPQRRTKAFFDRRRNSKEKLFDIGEPMLEFQTKIGSHSRSEVEGSRIPLLDSFYNLEILGKFQKVDTLVSHVINKI